MSASRSIIASSLLALSVMAQHPQLGTRVDYAQQVLAECGMGSNTTSAHGGPAPFAGLSTLLSPPPLSPSSHVNPPLSSSSSQIDPPPLSPSSSSSSQIDPPPLSPSSHVNPPFSPTSEISPPPLISSTTSISPLLLPETCYTTWEDPEGRTTTLGTHECYTRTHIIPATTCPKPECPPPAPDQPCPLYIKLSSVTEPCATDCCPTTATVSEAVGPCETCDPCRIPTEIVTYMTGCAGPEPTVTITNIVTPPFF
ncbi:hypothetical protein F5Y14DRAFT_451977 [Nemania sp. NC0429]|nr:hypothetical protein F5Y14DRAFT_451977 [Nemania sp. NC0429]